MNQPKNREFLECANFLALSRFSRITKRQSAAALQDAVALTQAPGTVLPCPASDVGSRAFS